MLAGLRIVAGVIAYRLRKLEMANMAAAASMAVALHLGPLDVAVRVLFAFLLNALVYLNNDYIDVAIDLQSGGKDNPKTRYLAANMRAAMWAQLMMLGILALGAIFYDPGLLVPLVAGGGICWWYSAKLKHSPPWDIVAMMIWGVTMPLVGSPADNLLGWALALQLGFFSGVFETIQVMRDAEEDAKEGVRTTGVMLGKKKAGMLARALMVLSTIYAALVLHPIAAAITLIALFIPCPDDRIEQYWTRVKLVYGVAWLMLCAWVFFEQDSAGLLWQVHTAASLTP
jgi:4-hydroxybenzoate polyprenyltransferase